MIVPTMSDEEIHAAVFKDFYQLEETTIPRLAKEYDRSRVKYKIAPDKDYYVWHEVKTKNKNPWLLSFSKAPSIEKYSSSVSCINYQAMTYYNTDKGIRVLKVNAEETGGLSAYNAHLFKRYAERTGVNLSTTIDKVKKFFTVNGYSKGRVIEKDGRRFTIMVCAEGLLLGEIQAGGFWCVHKTFIGPNEMRQDQQDLEAELISSLRDEIEQAYLTGTGGFPGLSFLQDASKGIGK